MQKLFRVWQATIALSIWVAAAAAQPGPPGQLDPGCVAECRQDVRVCTQALHTSARACRETCAAELAAVEAACDDPSSQACHEARAEARDCLQPCVRARAQASRECKNDARGCVSDCRQAEPTPDPDEKDPVCVQGCASVLRECLGAARDKAETCLTDGCSLLVDAAEEACEEGNGTEECRAARQAAHECLRDCRDVLREDTKTCVRTHASCVRDCPEEEPAP